MPPDVRRVLSKAKSALLGIGGLFLPMSLGAHYIARCTARGSIPLRLFWQRYYTWLYLLFRKLKVLRPEHSLVISEVVKNIGDTYLLQFDTHSGDAQLAQCGSILKESLDLFGPRGETLLALGFYYFLRNDYGAARDCLEKCIQFASSREQALGLLVQVCAENEDLESAFEYFRLLSVDHQSVIPNIAYYINAWRDDFAAIWRSYGAYRTLHPEGCPRWAGEPLDDKCLLVVGLSGIGDEIRFSSGYPSLIEKARRCIITCEPRLTTLFQRSFPAADVQPASRAHIYHLGLQTSQECIRIEGLAGVDYYTNNFSAMEFVRPHAISFSGQGSCLVPDRPLVRTWREKLASAGSGKTLVGLCWRSGINSYKRRRQHFTLEDVMGMFEGIECAIINLQYDGEIDSRTIQANAQPPLRMLDADLKDDMETLAAVIANLDLVISAPTSVAELAGCLGAPTWMISTVDGLTIRYRIRENHQDLWFPSMRHFNADRCGGQAILFQTLHQELQHFVEEMRMESPTSDPPSPVVRQARAADLEPIFELANLPSVRDASFHSEAIGWPEHVRWFQAVLADPLCGFYVSDAGGLLAGQVRFRREGNQAVVSISVNPEFRGKGVGAALFHRGLPDFRRRHPVREIVAKIKKRNEQSIAFFYKLGFTFSTGEVINGEDAVVLVYHPDELEVGA